jgi:hypothetical protein
MKDGEFNTFVVDDFVSSADDQKQLAYSKLRADAAKGKTDEKQ